MTNDSKMESEHRQFMYAAIEQARFGLAENELPIGSIVVREGKIVAAAYCKDRQIGLLAHAEMLAIEKAEQDHPTLASRAGSRLYTTLEPCLMCLGAAMSAFISEVIYAIPSPADGAVSLVCAWRPDAAIKWSYRAPVTTCGIMSTEARKLLEGFLTKTPSGGRADFARSVLSAEMDRI